MNRLALGNLLMSALLTIVGAYDVRHDLIGFGIVGLWIGGGCFVAALHVATRTSRATGRFNPK